jgi:hypothetical protein
VTSPSIAQPRTTSVFSLVVCACAASVACTPATALHKPPEPPPRSTTTVTKAERIDAIASGSSFQTYASTRFDFSLQLPDGAAFRIDDRTDRWFVATHAPTSSTLLVRMWREYELMSRSTCEERARLYRTLPERSGNAIVEQKRIDVPPGHDTIVDVHVRERASTPRIEGTVLAFGGWARGCFAFVFATQDDDERTVAARLSTIVHGTLSRMTFKSDLVPKRTPPDLKTPLRLETLEGPAE